ncbi:MAG: hypothetical protein IJW40_07705 [Clostridia bacterium]|nr:hypothetical protein [Clostridia bacterium]
MKKALIPRIAVLLCLAILFGSFACLFFGCTEEDQGDQEEEASVITFIENGATEYIITRREYDPERFIINLTLELRDALEAATGAFCMLQDDYEAPKSPEILVGETTRQESIDALASLGENEYVIKVVGETLVIVGQNDEATAQAVRVFIKEILGYNADADSYGVTELKLASDFVQGGTYVPGPTSTGGEETNQPQTPREPVTAPLMREDGVMYSHSSGTYNCNTDGQDAEFLHENRGNVLPYCRFTDGSAYIIYKFDIYDKYEPAITFTIGNDYKIQISGDNKTWQLVYDWTAENESVHDRSNQAAYTINPYDFEVYDTCYIRLSDSTGGDGWGACFVDLTFAYYSEMDIETLNIFDLSEDVYDILSDLDYTTEDPSSVDAYQIARDGGLIYNPISREKADQLSKYDSADCYTGTVSTTVNSVEYTLTYKIPKEVTAYDAVPIWYEVTSSRSNSTPVYIEATAFDDPDKTDGENYYALTLPGLVDVTWDYLGYVGGTDKLSNRAEVRADVDKSEPGAQYPQYNTTELIRSGNVKSTDILWWKFRYTNTGNTILDGDGNGTFCFSAALYVKQGGNWVQRATLENDLTRIFEELYPGESGEMYFTFDNAFDLAAGEYKIVLSSLVRNETSNPENYGKNIWGGETYSQSEFTFTISNDDEVTEPDEIQKTLLKDNASRNKWLHTYEEFMSSYDSLLRGVTDNKVTSTMYLQCAPWTEQVVLRLIVGNGDTMEAVSIPVTVETDSIKINFNPDNNNYVVLDDGTRFPVITAQSMADMRGNVQLGPDAAYNVIDNLMDMQDIGINVINTTAAFEYDASFGTSRANNIDACWFSLDVARLLGLRVEGWITYPYESSGSINQANTLFGVKLVETGFGSPDLALANALNTLWQYLRWGDNYWIGGDDVVVLDVEDTRGWMRVDFNARFTMDESSKQNFRIFLMDMYGSIDMLNADWETDYLSFDEIDPEEGTTDDHGWRKYANKTAVFKEWSRPLEVLDMFRTLERIEDYEMLLSTVKEDIPTAQINLRTEGANWLSTVDPATKNSHYRHVYYSQRRCAIIPELMAQSGVLYSASDYTTLPYTPSEVAELTASSIENGIVPMLLPQFNRMRDIAINPSYGNDFTYEYNLKGNATKGAYINTVCSVYEWFVATYENGGVPGILWQDYLCDGYATETQRREIAFFTEKLTEALNTPEGQAWAKNFDRDESVLDGSAAAWTFDREMVQDIIDRVAKER